MAKDDQTEAARIGSLITQLRESRGLTQEDLAHEVGVRTGTVSRWERGLQRGVGSNVLRLAEVLGVPPSTLLPPQPGVQTQLDQMQEQLGRIETAIEEVRDRMRGDASDAAQEFERAVCGDPPLPAPEPSPPEAADPARTSQPAASRRARR